LILYFFTRKRAPGEAITKSLTLSEFIIYSHLDLVNFFVFSINNSPGILF